MVNNSQPYNTQEWECVHFLLIVLLTFRLSICKKLRLNIFLFVLEMMGYIVFLIAIVFTPCFATIAPYLPKLTPTHKETVRSTLYSLVEIDKKIETERQEREGRQMKFRDSLTKMALAVQELDIEEPEETDDLEEPAEKAKESESSRVEETISKWKMVLDSKNNSYVKELFENDKELQEWIKNSSELLFYVTQSNNLDMLEFFVAKGAKINATRETTLFSPLHYAIVTQRKLNIIKFFLDHPETDLRQTNVWGENIFHMVFMGGTAGEEKSSKTNILQLLLQDEYFLKIADLLNTPNKHKETALDFAWRDTPFNHISPLNHPVTAKILTLLRDKGALFFRDLPENKKSLKQQAEWNECAIEFS